MTTRAGDVFTMDLGNSHVGLGRIIIKLKYQLFITVFETIFNANKIPKINDIANLKPVLMGYTLDGLLFSGDWKVIGNNEDNLGKYPLPFYKLGTPPEVYLVNHLGERIREATNGEIEILDYQTVLAPIYYEEALKAFHKVIPWDKSYNEILYEETQRKRAVVDF